MNIWDAWIRYGPAYIRRLLDLETGHFLFLSSPRHSFHSPTRAAASASRAARRRRSTGEFFRISLIFNYFSLIVN
jgi:hypothetical protein